MQKIGCQNHVSKFCGWKAFFFFFALIQGKTGARKLFRNLNATDTSRFNPFLPPPPFPSQLFYWGYLWVFKKTEAIWIKGRSRRPIRGRLTWPKEILIGQRTEGRSPPLHSTPGASSHLNERVWIQIETFSSF